jgi:hypothetical protein
MQYTRLIKKKNLRRIQPCPEKNFLHKQLNLVSHFELTVQLTFKNNQDNSLVGTFSITHSGSCQIFYCSTT